MKIKQAFGSGAAGPQACLPLLPVASLSEIVFPAIQTAHGAAQLVAKLRVRGRIPAHVMEALKMNWKISTKILGICGVYSILGLATAMVLVQRDTSQARIRTDILLAASQRQDQARLIQLDFKKQVQEWKDTLLRGWDPQSLAKYEGNFFEREKAVQTGSSALAGQLTNPQLSKTLDEFRMAHQKLGANYREALAAFQSTGGKNFKLADSMVKGKDRAATDGIDTLVAGIQADAQASVTSLDAASNKEHWITLGAASILWIVLFAWAMVPVRVIVKPMTEAVELLEKVASGDMTRRLQVRTKDEVGQMGVTLNKTLESVSELIRAIKENAELLSQSVGKLSEIGVSVKSASEETSMQSQTVSAAAQQVSANLTTVAAATQEMSSSIQEIARNAHDSAKVASEAVELAGGANTALEKLRESSAQIGQVTKLIIAIATQTNLLALNATIEAARAGEAGKGFAVVANEVKALAKQTSQATDGIRNQVAAIQTDSTRAAESIGRIGEVVGRTHDIANTIATAVEEQTSVTNEISRNISEASHGGSEIAKNIEGVAQSNRETDSNVTLLQNATIELGRMAGQLKEMAGKFQVASKATDKDSRNKRDTVIAPWRETVPVAAGAD
jgi:methyl-accepting chemotaxis protein